MGPMVSDVSINLTCIDCGTPYQSEAALERCDCGQEDKHYSPSRGRVSYTLGDD